MYISLRKSLMLALVSLSFLPFTGLVAAQQTVDTKDFKGLEWRMVGPWRGGRVTTVTGVRGKPNL